MRKMRLLVAGLLIGLTACTGNLPKDQMPEEDTDVMIEAKPVDPTVIVTAVPDDSTAPLQSNIEAEQDIEKPNKAIVPVSPSAIKAVPKNAAVIALLDSAKQQSQGGKLHSAQTSLQRAQRIAPREPEVYYDLAKVHLDLQDYGLAEQVALKGVSIVQGQPKKLYRFWSLIAEIRKASGNGTGAKKAKATANRYN